MHPKEHSEVESGTAGSLQSSAQAPHSIHILWGWLGVPCMYVATSATPITSTCMVAACMVAACMVAACMVAACMFPGEMDRLTDLSLRVY